MNKIKVMSVVGTRPEIIRLSRVFKALDCHCDLTLVHTGQNYDYELNQVFFKDLDVRRPDYFLHSAEDSEGPANTIGNLITAVDRARAGETTCSACPGRYQQLSFCNPRKAPKNTNLSHGSGQSMFRSKSA